MICGNAFFVSAPPLFTFSRAQMILDGVFCHLFGLAGLSMTSWTYIVLRA